MEESRLVRTAWAALSSMVIHSEAGTMKTGRCCAAEVLPEEGAQDIFGANEVDPDVVLTRSEDGPANLWFGGLIGTHCVNDDVDRHQEKITGLLLKS